MVESAQVVPFPCAARVALVQSAAAGIAAARSEKSALMAWQRVVVRLERQMADIGLNVETIDGEIGALALVVKLELRRRATQSAAEQGGDAA
ncbi:DUF6074 family protein [Aurantimonas sp. C2-6-R+9]|uniref:DUF6074 family protein n=1 Tax=unclassified Aurantimonas TaxID=2638230 RepID=UPI002E18B813|nr:DUF6074 family protein [Aurantimonas sp. C2-6-R+9]